MRKIILILVLASMALCLVGCEMSQDDEDMLRLLFALGLVVGAPILIGVAIILAIKILIAGGKGIAKLVRNKNQKPYDRKKTRAQILDELENLDNE